MTSPCVNVLMFVNRFDSESKSVTVKDLPLTTTIGRIKSDLFANDIISRNNIRFIYRGVKLDDSIQLTKFEAYDGTIKLIVFITKPPVIDITNTKTEARIWSTFGCITFVFIMWFYKLKFSDTFNWTANAIFYIATMLTLHTIISNNVFRNVDYN